MKKPTLLHKNKYGSAWCHFGRNGNHHLVIKGRNGEKVVVQETVESLHSVNKANFMLRKFYAEMERRIAAGKA